MASQLQEPVVARSGASVHSREEDEFTQQREENPLEVASGSSIQATPSIMERSNPLEQVPTYTEPMDEPPPPYEALPDANAPQLAPIEYSCENSPQLLNPSSEFPEPPPRNPARLSGSYILQADTVQSPISLSDPSAVPAPLHIRSNSSTSIPRRPLPSQGSSTPTTFSSAKAREAGFELHPPPSPQRSGSSGSLPSITLLPSTEKLHHIREAGKVTAYLIPFPKPRLKGVRAEDVPDRFLIYTPLLPPLSKPAPGEKESHWHKTQRTWQEDVRKATMTNASKATWKGMKARTTTLINKGVNLTRSSNVEFLDRVSGGAITSTTQEPGEQEQSEMATPPATPSTSASSTVFTPSEAPTSPSETPATPRCPIRSSTGSSMEKVKDAKPKALEELTLIFPPSLNLGPEKIRVEFTDTLMRTREKSRKDAFVASALMPFAAAIDASLIFTLGGLTQVSGVWAYTSTRGAMTSGKISRALERSQSQAAEEARQEQEEIEVHGCTCGHHTHDFGNPEIVHKSSKAKGKKKGLHLQLQQSTHIEILRRSLDLACLKKDYSMFPQVEEATGDVNEESVLEAIGWKPTRRYGRDLELEFKDRVETFTPEQDEQYQLREAKEDVKRIMRKGATEWVTWCKLFQKDPEAALKK